MVRPIFIAWLEVKRYLADRGDLAFSLALPIALFALMYGVFSGDVSFSGTAHIVDLDKGPIAQQLMARLEEVDGLDIKLHTLEEAKSALDRSNILTAIVIPDGFSEGLQSGTPVSLTFRRRGSGGDVGQIVSSIVQGIAQDIAGDFQVRHTVNMAFADSSIPQAEIDSTVDRLLAEADATPFVEINSRIITGEEEDFIDRLLPGILIMFLMFAVALNSQTLVEERRIGTLERLLTTRLGINQLFVGKFLAGAGRATLQALVLLSLGFAVLQLAGAATFFQALLFSILVAAAVSAIGLLIAAFARTRDQATWAAVFFTMFMTVFGGTFFDVRDVGALDILSRLTLNRYAIDAMEGIISESGSIIDYGLEIAVMASIAVAGLALARLAFRVTQVGR